MIRLLFAVAVAAFVLSLPIQRTGVGAMLRRVAGFCFTLALVPSIVLGLFFPGGVEAHPFALAGMLVLLVAGAYAYLRLRAAVVGKDAPRVREKTPVDRTRRREQEILAFMTERPGADEDR